MVNLDVNFHSIITQVYKLHRRIGFKDAKIEIAHCLIDKDPGYDFTLYDEDYGHIVPLYSLKERDRKNTNLHGIASRFANEIKEKTGLDILVIKEIQGSPMIYDEHDEAIKDKMWIARMAMQGIDDDY